MSPNHRTERGHVSPGIRAAGKRENDLLDAIRARGLWLVQLPGPAQALHLHGPGGINIKAASLSTLSLSDLGALHDHE